MKISNILMHEHTLAMQCTSKNAAILLGKDRRPRVNYKYHITHQIFNTDQEKLKSGPTGTDKKRQAVRI